jgi:hypothetical protein
MPTIQTPFGLTPGTLWRWALIGGFVLIAGLNLPGHLSVDSVIALAEGRSGLRITWGPPMYSAILGVFDSVEPGTGLYVATSLLLLFASWAGMAALRPRMSWAAPVLLLAAISLPQVLIYQGIVWKDVLFANLTIAAFVALARAGGRWETRGAAWSLAFAWICLALGCLVRQNGAVAVLFAAIALGWMAAGGRWRRGLIWGAVGFVVPLLLAVLLNAITPVHEPPGVASKDKGVRLVQNYDLVAAIAENPQRPMPILQAASPRDLVVLRQEAPRVYSPVRVDTLSRSEALGVALWRFKDDAIGAQWRQMIVSDPLGYAGRRLAVFDWVFLTPQIDQCLPIHVGVAGPPQIEAQLNLVHGMEPQDTDLYNYATWWFDTPLYSHLAYAVMALAVAGFLLMRRQGGDVAIAGLMFAGLSFAASFFVISLACDYRYLYALDLAAITGVLYVAIDPRGRNVESVGRGSAWSRRSRTSP